MSPLYSITNTASFASKMSSPDPYEDPFSQADNNYHFRVPTPSSIYPRPNPNETLSALFDVNESLPPEKRLPHEILLLIKDEVHMVGSKYAELRSKWTPVLQPIRPYPPGAKLLWITFDKNKKTFLVSEEYKDRSEEEIYSWFIFSSANFLYRVRCLFPEIHVQSSTIPEQEAVTWEAGLRHKESGVLLILTEHDAFIKLIKTGGDTGKAFIEDVRQLLNMLFGTVDGKRFYYYHPAADAELPAADQRYLAEPGPRHAVPEDITRGTSCRLWKAIFQTPIDVLTSSTYKSVLQQLKYDTNSRKVDLEHGTENLTSIMSSSLLYLRLLCQWCVDPANVYDRHPVISVWQVHLQHDLQDVRLLFLDDRGLFDIRVDGDENLVMNDIVALVDMLFSDQCCHLLPILVGTFDTL
ncbi:hypothetical protein Clacol_002263 [Clathrus columnatus]|uniref:Uncharacterized protein n=1 Tax=Clathrus columnatus TaxID=1419009 RepID=A0AAV5A091_9AGAM|nr:hypothetical protein Clacol_002263 [Clathrus columnatus]